MRIVLDDFETGLRADTVGAALDAAARTVEENGRMIVEVEIDGVTWTEEDLASAEYRARPAGEVRLVTAHPAELLRDALVQAAEAVLDAERAQRTAATELQAGRAAEGMQALLEVLALWGSVQTVVSRGLELGVLRRDEIASLGFDLDGPIAALDARLRELRDGMQRQDVAAVADVLLYEFPGVSKSFATVLAALATEVDRRTPARQGA